MKFIISEKQYQKLLNEEQNQIEYSSEFLDGVNVVVVFKEDPLYHKIKELFDEYGFGFMVPNQNLIIIDGEILIGETDSKNVLKFIEAHEVSHVLLNHNGPRNEQDEIEADLGAYLLLRDKGYYKSMEMLIDYFEDRHGLQFTEDLLNTVIDRIF